jgi:phosphoglycerol transferase MdoB-like AlkP superfamily enzyme
VGDHGIRGSAGDMLPEAFTEQGLTAEHVPLLLYAPSLLKSARYNFPASQLDILPTIAGLCNISYRNNSLGSDLLNDAYSSARNAFIIDIDTRRIGMVQDGLFYSYNLNGSGEQISSLLNNEKVVITDSLQKSFRKATDAYYETARYLLLNNKKKK